MRLSCLIGAVLALIALLVAFLAHVGLAAPADALEVLSDPVRAQAAGAKLGDSGGDLAIKNTHGEDIGSSVQDLELLAERGDVASCRLALSAGFRLDTCSIASDGVRD